MFDSAIDLMYDAGKLLDEVDHDLVDARTRVNAIAEVRRAIDQLECQWLLLVGEADRREDAAAVDYLTTASMLRNRMSLSHGARNTRR